MTTPSEVQEPQVKVWAPILKGDEKPTLTLWVPCLWDTPPNEAQYKSLLEARLNSLIRDDPKQAMSGLRSVSTPEYPGFYPELRWHPPHQWAFLMMLSDQMCQILNRIDWSRDNPVRQLPVEELPSLIDILELV